MKRIVYLIVIIFFGSACQHVKTTVDGTGINLSATVAGSSFSGVGSKVDNSALNFIASDVVGIYMTEMGVNLTSKGNQTDNHKFTYNGTIWSGSELVNPFTGKQVNVYGYYPYNPAMTDATRITYTTAADQSAGIMANSYFLRGVTANGTPITPSVDGSSPTSIALIFTNRLTKLVANPTLTGATYTVTNVYALNQPAHADFNLQTDKWTISEATTEIKMAKNAAGKYECLTIPNVYAPSTELFRIELSDGASLLYFVQSKTAGASITLLPNEIHTFEVNNQQLACLTEFVFEMAGGMLTANIVTNMTEAWTLTPKDTDWLTVANKNEVTATKNDTKKPRLGLLTLANGVYSYDVLVMQK